LIKTFRYAEKIIDQYVKKIIDQSVTKIIGFGPWRSGLVVSSPPAMEETGAMRREIESRHL
jgi:hypothetical protein